MGLDLTLLPHKHHHAGGTPLLCESLRLDRDYELFNMIERASQKHGIAAGVVAVHSDDGWRDTSHDPYGTALRYIRAGDLAAALGTAGGDTPWNVAVLAFVRALPTVVPVYLWWH